MKTNIRKIFSTVALMLAFFILTVACNNQKEESPSTQKAESISTLKQIVADQKSETTSTKTKGFIGKPPVGTKAFCPVMENEFEVNENTEMSKHDGKTYAFCCGGCKPKFDANPQEYL